MRLLLIVMICLSPAFFQGEASTAQGDRDDAMAQEKKVTFISPYNHERPVNRYGISSRMMELKYYC